MNSANENIITIKKILRENNLWPKKRLGQNFLVDQKVLTKIIEASNLSKDDTILEIGPGFGILTEELAKYAKLVLAIEKDYKLVNFLRKKFKSNRNIKIIHTDILEFNGLTEEQASDFKIVANLPYNITSVVIRKFLELNPNNLNPSLMVLMVQKEVAERICAKPGNSNRGILTLAVEFYGRAEIVEIVDKSKFWPIPRVDSAIIKIELKNKESEISKIDSKMFFRIVKIGFSQKRRQIHHPLRAGLGLPKDKIIDILKLAKINEKLRAEELTLNDWISLYEYCQKFVG